MSDVDWPWVAEERLRKMDILRAENERLRNALVWIAGHPAVERNPDGDDQAAITMQWIAREALGDG